MKIAPEARGKIGEQAAAYGLGTKADENGVGASYWSQYPADHLQTMPTATDPSWSAEDIATVESASSLAARAGEYSAANLWRKNLTRPKSIYVRVEALPRMADKMWETALALRGQRQPTVPAKLLSALTDLDLDIPSQEISFLPAEIQDAVVAKLNDLSTAMAQAGFATRAEIKNGFAPAAVLALNAQYSGIHGATVRALRQVCHLVRISRAGQTMYSPMTLGRRLMLVNSALTQLAESIEIPAWTAQGLGLVTPELRAAWASRAAAEPFAPPNYRTLFAWADRDKPPAAELDDPDLERLIQQHPDIAYVEVLREERRRRVRSGAQWA